MDISTRQVLKRTLATTNAHVEIDNLILVEEKWADSSILCEEYTDYDVAEIPIVDASVIEEMKKHEPEMRNTHLCLADDVEDELKEMNKYYADNKIGPYAYAFTGPTGGGGGDDIEPIPSEDISTLLD